jgi:SAM-dependent methyltransferase
VEWGGQIRAKRRRLSPARLCILLYGVLLILDVLVCFPYATDPQTSNAAAGQGSQRFYEQAYSPSAALSREEQEKEEVYVRVASLAAERADIKGMIKRFVEDYHLQDKRVLDVGAGRGYLQDMVGDYTGLDIAPTARRYFHKPFVLASATAMPFKDSEFDAIWTVWVLEHIPNPESALREMRRVVKPGGVILLAPAWFCPPWAADGYEVRPYSDFGLAGRFTKASIPIRSTALWQLLQVLPARFLRYAGSRMEGAPSRFHYWRLSPNYDQYWVPDSDAVNSMDPYEALLWFTTRGDKCLNCPAGVRDLTRTPERLVIRVKPAGSA